MKVLFINPPTDLHQRYGWLSFAGSTMPSLGLCWLAAIARKAGWKVKIIDASSLGLSFDETLKQVMDFAPDCVALTSTTFAIGITAELAKAIKRQSPQAKIIMGGPHLSALPKETLKLIPEVDIGIIGEGEATLPEVLTQQPLSDIKGIIYRAQDKIILNENRTMIADLDTLPLPAWDLLADFPHHYRPVFSRIRKLPAASLITTRGCPNQCAFCDRSVLGNRCRSFSPDYIVKMIEVLHYQYGVKEILFEDDTIFVFQSRLRTICESLISKKIQISWSCLGRVDKVDANLLNLMKSAGCWQIGYGIESGNQEMLNFMKKNIRLEQIENAVLLTKQAGIKTKGFFMLGFPGETDATIKQTMNFVRKLHLDDLTVTQFTPLPGSEIYETVSQYGVFENNWDKMNLLESLFVPHGLSKSKLAKYTRRLTLQFYLRPKIIWQNLSRLLTFIYFQVVGSRGKK
ncbi:MAG: radical SAM protein [bacterium]